jgi:DNA-binding transcriptional LysR family regulator
MNIRHLRFFVALSRKRHYGRAAASCNVTQSTLFEAIRQLKHELAVPLIDRYGRRFGGLTPHISGTSLSAQARYAAGTGEILECWFENRPIRDEYLIIDKGKLAGAGAHSYSAGNATRGSEEAAKFKRE